MAQETITAPASPYQGPPTRDATTETGDAWKEALRKINANFDEIYAREDVSAFVQDDGSFGVANEGAHEVAESSFQPLWSDLNVGPAVGSDEPTDSAYIAAFMGNVFGDDPLTEAANIIAGVIGKYNVPGAVASDYPVGGVIGEIGEACTDADAPDGAVVGVIGGDSGAVLARAIFAARILNSTAGAGVEFGMDLFDPKAAGLSYQALVPTKADLRLSNEVCILSGDGAPVDYTDGDPVATGEGWAGPGSLYIDRTNKDIYINDGTKAEPTWNELAKV